VLAQEAVYSAWTPLEALNVLPAQLVQGTNYDITFHQKVKCRGQAPSPVVLEALVYEPLPLAGNTGPMVQSVHETG
jgi:hypothetical protein